MIVNREQIARMNIERFHQLLRTEADPARRRVLERLLVETRAELEFLAESDSAGSGPQVWQISEERIRQLRKKADECRMVACTYSEQSTRDVLYRLAAGYEAIANGFDGLGRGPPHPPPSHSRENE